MRTYNDKYDMNSFSFQYPLTCRSQAAILSKESIVTLSLKMLMLQASVTRYAELGGSWNSEVNKGNHARQGSVLFDF